MTAELGAGRLARQRGRKMPIRLLHSPLSDTWYIVTRYRVDGNHLVASVKQEVLPEDLENMRRLLAADLGKQPDDLTRAARVTLQPADLDRLEQLAREATEKQIHPANWSHHIRMVLMACPARDFMEAASPAVVSELVAAARLGAAWQEAEAALPEGMSLAGVRERRPLAESERWEASAKSTFKVANPRGALYEYGPTPAAALLALAEALRKRP